MKSTIEPSNASRENLLAVVEDLRKKYGDKASKLHDTNEAKTRILLIDTVLRALGWLDDDFNPETSTKKGFIDYLLSTDGIPRLVIEAKRVSHTFRNPSTKMKKATYPLRYFRKAYGQALTEVLDQATNYALQLDVPFVALTNGAEWLLIQVIPFPGGVQDPDDLNGFYFGNILSDEFNLDMFWELLSKNFVLDGVLEDQFAQLNSKESDFNEEPRTQLGDLHWRKTRDDRNLGDFYHHFFDDIIDQGRRKMLELCFVTSARLDQYQGELRRALKDTAPSFLTHVQDISPEDRDRILPLESGDQKGRVILVTGSVGCGKSTFVTKGVIEARQERNLICLVIDLIDEVMDNETDIVPTLWKYLSQEWRKQEPESYHSELLRKIFGKELSELKRGPHEEVFKHDIRELERQEANLLERLSNDPEEFFSRCWRFYMQKRKGIAVILDNVDRASENYQRHAYSFAHKLARITGATVIITMREATFFRGRESGFLDVRANDTVFHLQTPNLEHLLSKRIKYVQEHLQEDHRISTWRNSKDWELFQAAAQNYAEILKQTFLKAESGRESLGLLAAIAWHDVRSFLALLPQLHAMLGNIQKPWKVSEILAALMSLPDAARLPSAISNIYRPAFASFPSYFLKIRALLMLIYGRPDYELRRGITLTRILVFLRTYGYQERWVKQSIQEMVRERLLECFEIPAEAEYTKDYRLVDTHSFRPSPLAVIVVDRISFEPIYLCLVGNSLPFHKQFAFKRYKDALESILKVLDESQLERTAIDLLKETELEQIVAKYLVEASAEEEPVGNLAKNIPEVKVVEQKLSQIILSLSKLANVEHQGKKIHSPPQQASLQLEEEYVESRLTDIVQIPKSINEVKVGLSTSAPLIFWSLVALKTQGYRYASGMQITKVINDHLVDDHNKREPTNISRALRGKVLPSQKWLAIKKAPNSKRKLFGLTKDWKKYWEEFFEEEAPNID